MGLKSHLRKALLHEKLLQHPEVDSYSHLASNILVTNFVMLLFTFLYYQNESYVIGQRLLEASILGITSSFVVKFLARPKLAVSIILAAGIHALIIASLWAGGLSAPGISWAPVGLIFLTYHVPTRTAIFWVAMYVLAIVLVGYFDFNKGFFVQDISPDQLSKFKFSAIVGSSLFVSYLSWSYKQVRDKTYEAVKQKDRELTMRLEELKVSQQLLQSKLEQNLTLVRVFSHDISNFVHRINAISHRMDDSANDKNKLKNVSSKISETISSIREYQSALDGKVGLSVEEINIENSVQSCIDLLKDRFPNKNLKVEIHSSSLINQPLFNRSIFENQVLMNLLSNAIKFSSKDCKLDFYIQSIGARVELKIVDYGIGIPKDIIPELFHFNVATSRVGVDGEKGSGYGLPIAKVFLDKYGCQIEVQSRDAANYPNNHGTEVIILFPTEAMQLQKTS